MLRSFTSDKRVIDIGTRLLAIAAAFQLFDGTQAVATGVLRGLGETRMPMIVNVIGHWVFGLPVGYALCFVFGWGVTGLWMGSRSASSSPAWPSRGVDPADKRTSSATILARASSSSIIDANVS